MENKRPPARALYSQLEGTESWGRQTKTCMDNFRDHQPKHLFQEDDQWKEYTPLPGLHPQADQNFFQTQHIHQQLLVVAQRKYHRRKSSLQTKHTKFKKKAIQYAR